MTKQNKKKKEEKLERLQTKDFFDCIAPGVIRFMPDYYIVGDSYRSVWAIREYPPITEQQAIFSRIADRTGVTLRIYHRLVEAIEQRKIIQNATRKNKMKSTGNDINDTVEAESNLQDVIELLSNMRKNREIYYFKDEVEISLSDANDEMAMFNVYDAAGELLGNFAIDEVYVINKSGFYTVEAVNHYGKTETFTLNVSLSAPEVLISENLEKKILEIDITNSEDKDAHIETLDIFKSTDGGETWVLLLTDDYGKEINVETLSYKFCSTGIYKVIISDEFRTGIDAVTKVIEYNQPIPEGKLSGVENEGYTNGEVKFDWTDEATVTLEKDGMRLEYKSGEVIKEDGKYSLTFENRDGYKAVYNFVIDTVAPEIQLEGAHNGESVNVDVRVLFAEKDLNVELFKDGKSVRTINSETLFSDDGYYKIVATDLAENITEVTFTIDKIVDYTVNVNDKGLANSVTITCNEETSMLVTKNGEKINYALGEEITEPAIYAVTITDSIGNKAEFMFTIVEPVVQKFEYNFDDMPGFEKVVIADEEIRLNYGTLELKEDGVYEIGVVVNGETYIFNVTVDTIAPELVINGVENGGKTKTDVVITEVSEPAEIKVYLNDTEIEYQLGDKLTQAGQYRVKAMDECGNCLEYAFEISKGLNGGIIALIVISCLVVVGGAITVIILKRKNVF